MTRLPSRLSATCFRTNIGRRTLGHRVAMSPNFRRDRLERLQGRKRNMQRVTARLGALVFACLNVLEVKPGPNGTGAPVRTTVNCGH